ncbi:Protein of unknown function [Cotesia congregata]|uniref:Uncharacterized protein n=1 Tax=Cotesia congregata TaxID=51543 RepID=A0A8J2H030_COTCN|nr:Protein of unknown function [Cotesia congregata]
MPKLNRKSYSQKKKEWINYIHKTRNESNDKTNNDIDQTIRINDGNNFATSNDHGNIYNIDGENSDNLCKINVDNSDCDDSNSSENNSDEEEPVNIEDESTLLMTQAIVFAPGEGQSPVSLFDEYAEALSFIKIYGGKLVKKPQHLTYQNWIKSEIMRSDRRCATILKLFFSALKLLQTNQNS